MDQKTCKLLIIGAGPGGYACAIRAAQSNVDTIIVEAAKPGGTCLNVGCIPSKALIHAAEEFSRSVGFATSNDLGISFANPKIDFKKTYTWKEGIVSKLTRGVSGLLKKSGAEYIQGFARIIDGKTVEVDAADGPVRIRAENLVIATGSRSQELATLPFGEHVISSTEALNMQSVPRSLTIVGGGYIGLEIGTALAKLGAKITIVEAAERVLPQFDERISRPVVDRLNQLGVTLYLNAKAQGLSDGGRSLVIRTDKAETAVVSEKIMVAVGREPVLEGFGLEDLNLTMNGRFISIDMCCATSMAGVYAIGDVTGDPMLAHRAIAQGVLVADRVTGSSAVWDKAAIPAVCFTDPEIVSIGALPNEVGGSKIAQFPFAGNGRSMTLQATEGFVRIVYDPQNEFILGLQAVGAGVAEFAGQFALALEMGATLTDIAETIHAHPTLGETIQEAAHLGLGRALHI